MDDISTSTLWIALLVLIILSAFFSSSETAMMSLNRYRLRHLTKEGHKGARRASDLLDRTDRLIGLILIGNNLANNAAATIASIIGLRLLGDLGVALTPFVLTLGMLLLAEVTPKTLAALYPEKVAFPSAWFLKGLMKVFYPVVWVVNGITNGLLALLHIKPESSGADALSSEELRTVVAEAGAMIPRRHKDMLVSILDLEKVQVEDVMTPRSDIKGIDINDDWSDIVKQLTHAQHTRLLLYRDNIDDAVGFVHARDALRLLSKNQFTKSALLRAVREIYFIPEGTPLNVQLLKFQRNKERIGLVVDEYGDIQGLVTLEDILEEIVGDFTTDQAPAPHEEIVPQPDGSYLVEGSISLRELNKEMSWDFPTDGPKTLNGLILEHLEEIPEANISIRLAGYPLEIIDVKDNMVKTARILPQYKKD
ncbi:CNNM domain-containing protein [Gallaecimonas kandeliae]|uniref:HlyC/CorC family transporter n=1 Tax=Gallaecimonas kandeliae TaxID=3029055 RepID=UPI00264A3CA4|nr:CNNM domain-containing protein [Gallaecimonas kandeliae]WKE66467.1 CNNM domain-containing protein [Gallaecimonas kandeliae]